MLPKHHRFRSVDFNYLRGARVFHSSHFFAQAARVSTVAPAKGAAVVSAKTGKTAVARNRLRRRIYAALDARVRGARGFLLVVTAKGGAAALSFAELKSELSALLLRAFSG